MAAVHVLSDVAQTELQALTLIGDPTSASIPPKNLAHLWVETEMLLCGEGL